MYKVGNSLYQITSYWKWGSAPIGFLNPLIVLGRGGWEVYQKVYQSGVQTSPKSSPILPIYWHHWNDLLYAFWTWFGYFQCSTFLSPCMSLCTLQSASSICPHMHIWHHIYIYMRRYYRISEYDSVDSTVSSYLCSDENGSEKTRRLNPLINWFSLLRRVSWKALNNSVFWLESIIQIINISLYRTA